MKNRLAYKVVSFVLIIMIVSLYGVYSIPLAQTTPVLEVDVTELDFGETETSMTFTITNTGGGTLDWSLSEDEEWITVDVTSGSLDADLSDTVTVEVDRTVELTGEEVTSTIAITSNDVNAEIAVSMILPPLLAVDVTELNFGEMETTLAFIITNEGGGTLEWSLSEEDEWIAVDVTSGTLETTLSETVSVSVDRSGLFPIGAISGAVTVDAGDVSITIAVTMMPLKTVGPASLDFGSEDVVKELFVNNRGSGSLEWSITTQEVWVAIDAESGSTDEGMIDVIQVTVNRSAVTVLGSYTDVLEFASDAGDIAVPLAMEKSNHLPDIPTSVAPVDGATNQLRTTTLTCRGGDDDTGEGDVVTYSIYFSTNEMLVASEDTSVLMCSEMSTCYCDPGTMSLENATTYYWKAVAQDSYGAITPSDVWSFSTEAPANGLCPAFALELRDEDFGLLRRLRDEIMAGDEEGRIYIETYYRHGWELFLILLTSRELRMEAREIVEEVLPFSRSLLADREVLVPQELLRKVTAFLGKVSRYAHPRLKTALTAMQVHFQEREEWERFGITITGNP
jgi:hypothetical protein